MYKITIRKAIQNLSDEDVNKVQERHSSISEGQAVSEQDQRLQGKSVEPWTRVQGDIIQHRSWTRMRISQKADDSMGTKKVIHIGVWSGRTITNRSRSIDLHRGCPLPGLHHDTFERSLSFYQVMDECYPYRPNHSVLEIDGRLRRATAQILWSAQRRRPAVFDSQNQLWSGW